MFALISLAYLLAASIVAWGIWAYIDYRADTDNNPDSHTASEEIEAWEDRHPVLRYSVPISLGLLVSIPIILFFHLWLRLF